MILFEDFIVRALMAGLGLALVGGPLGCFIVWRRMAYFGDTMSHTALLGLTIGFLLNFNLIIGVLAIGFLLALFLSQLTENSRYGIDTLLGIFSHSALALGLVVLSMTETIRIDLMGYLFGDILAVNIRDLAWVFISGAFVLTTLFFLWPSLLLATLSPELARTEGIRVDFLRFTLMIIIALIVAVAMKVVGILLITALLIIPAATARAFSHTPEAMAIIASGIGCMAVGNGVVMSITFDTPTGPSIVVVAFILFVMSLIVRRKSL